jgi:hypothetical protein
MNIEPLFAADPVSMENRRNGEGNDPHVNVLIV